MKINTLRRPVTREYWMPYLVVAMAFLAVRLGAVFWRLVDPARWHIASRGGAVLPILGLIALPWTTLAFLASGTATGLSDGAWVLVGVALLFDLLMYDRGVWGRPSSESAG